MNNPRLFAEPTIARSAATTLLKHWWSFRSVIVEFDNGQSAQVLDPKREGPIAYVDEADVRRILPDHFLR